MNNNWIYVGADFYNHQWSRVVKANHHPHILRTSSRCPGYFIYTAYSIVSGDIDQIEHNLLTHLESQPGFKRLIHFRTSRKSECFLAHPEDIISQVESCLARCYPSCVAHDAESGEISRYQCGDWVLREFNRCKSLFFGVTSAWPRDDWTVPGQSEPSSR